MPWKALKHRKWRCSVCNEKFKHKDPSVVIAHENKEHAAIVIGIAPLPILEKEKKWWLSGYN